MTQTHTESHTFLRAWQTIMIRGFDQETDIILESDCHTQSWDKEENG